MFFLLSHVCEASTKDKWWTMHKILADNGFDPSTMKDKERSDLLQGILLDNRTQFGHEYLCEESTSKNPMLAKYFYIEDDGVQRALENRDSIGSASSCDLKEQALQSAITAGGVKLTMVKSENPLFEEFKAKLAVLTSAKNALDKLTGQASDLYYQIKASTDKGCQTKAPELKVVLEKMYEHLAESREFVAECKTVDASNDDIQKKITSMTLLCDLALAHQDGFKVFRKKCVAMLS
jgi:hypothetical protein